MHSSLSNCLISLTQIPGSTSYFGAIGTDAYGETLGRCLAKERNYQVNDLTKFSHRLT